MTWDDQLAKQIDKHVKNQLRKAAYTCTNAIKETLNVTGNPYRASSGPSGNHYKNENPSSPGEPPHKMLGDLQRSIAWEMISDDEARIGTNSKYATPLEFGTSRMAARPFMRATLDRIQDEIARIMSEPTT